MLKDIKNIFKDDIFKSPFFYSYLLLFLLLFLFSWHQTQENINLQELFQAKVKAYHACNRYKTCLERKACIYRYSSVLNKFSKNKDFRKFLNEYFCFKEK